MSVMSATHSWLMLVAVNSRCTRSGAARLSLSRLVVTHHARRRLTPRRPLARITAAMRLWPALIPWASEFGLTAWHAVGGIAGSVGLAVLLQQRSVGLSLCAGRSLQPVVVAAVRHTQRPAQSADRKFGLVRLHEFVDEVDVFSLLPANQAVAFAKMSRSC